jgi:hypothetical protein
MRDTEVSVDRDYDLFEQFPDGSVIWKNRISGREASIAKLTELATQTQNEIYVIHLPSKEIIARLNVAPQ